MRIEFDPTKDAINRTKHGISLGAAERLDWDNALIWPDTRFDYDEERMVGWGMIDGTVFYITFVERGDVTRVISLRPAGKKEIAQYVYHHRRNKNPHAF